MFQRYLCDLAALLKEKAREASNDARDASLETNERKFAQGRLMGFYDVISLMQQQATAFGIPIDEIGLGDIDPDVDLL